MKRQQPNDIEVRWNALYTRIQSHADLLATQGCLVLKRSKK
jgi:hypothetical protein